MRLRHRCARAWRDVRDELRAGPQAPGEPRGVALLVVLMVMAIVAAFSAEYNYKSYIRLHVASNIRDDAIAYYHARSAMEVARLVIKSKNMLASELGLPAAITKQAPEMWAFACEFANAFCTGKLRLMGKPFFDFKGMGGVGVEKGGMCKCRAKPEDGRVNVNRVNTPQEKAQLFMELYSEMIRHREEPMLPGEIDRERAEVALNIIDWVDTDTNRTDLTPLGIVDSPQAEALSIDKGVEPKNARFDTLAELQYVAEVTPDLYCAMADKLTPYDTKTLNVNEAPLSTLRGLICDPQNIQNPNACFPSQQAIFPAVDYALYCADICRTVRQSLMSSGFKSADQFTKFIGRLPAHLGVAPRVKPNMKKSLGVKSRKIRIETVGGSYGTYRGLTGVIDTDTGDWVYWREY